MTDSTVSGQITTSHTSTAASSVASARVGNESLPFLLFRVERDIRIQQFPTPLPDPLQNYRPSYMTLPDGSLLTSVYRADLFSANSRLFGVGALLTLGAINVWTCVSYIRRGKIKDKTLFYLLLASQILLPTCFGALLSPFFLDNVDCAIVNIIAVITTELSYAILITGILGLKAYRCLSRSRFILVVVWVLQLSIFVLFALDIRGINSLRRISGSCGTNGTLKFTPIALVLTVVETLFLALCFLYAVWKSTLYPAAQGRLSIALSEKAPIVDPRDDIVRRGWWDYIPRAPASEGGSFRNQGISGTTHAHTNNGDLTRPSGDSLVSRLRDSVMRLTTSTDLQHQILEPLEPQTFTRKPSIPTEYPLSQSPRPLHNPQQSQVSEKDRAGVFKVDRQSTSTMAQLSEVPPSARATSVKSISFSPQPPSQRSSQIDPLQPGVPRQHEDELGATYSIASKRLPAVLQVRAVIKDEMIYTSIIMLSCVVAAVLAFWRARENDVVFGPSVWLGANWAAISLLVMRTFSKVVQRHEREAILQSPSAYGGPLLSRNDFRPNVAAVAIARRRRDALALARSGSSVPSSPAQLIYQRRLARRSSWDYVTSAGYIPSLFEDNASLRPREALKAWEQENEQEWQRQKPEDPFADFHDIAKVDIFDGEDGDIGRRKSGEGPFGAEEMMLNSESTHREMILQEPMIASPWGESPFTYVDFGIHAINSATVSDGKRDPMNSGRGGSISPFETGRGLGRRGSAISRTSNESRDQPRFLQPFSHTRSVSPSTSASLGRAGPAPVGAGMRRGAIVSPETFTPPKTHRPITPTASVGKWIFD